MNLALRGLFLVLVLFSRAGFAADAPVLANPNAAPGANGQAGLSASVTANGSFTTVTFRYGLSADYSDSAQVTVDGTANNKAVSVNLTGLVGGQTYHYRVEASNAAGQTQTADATFAEPAYTPTLATQAPTGVSGGKATLRGTVTANGTPGTVFFEYGLTNAYGQSTPPIAIGAGDIRRAVTAELSGLERDKTYHFHLVFQDAGNVTIASTIDQTFVTANNLPVAVADSYSLPDRQPISLAVLKNDRDADGDPIAITAVTQPANGMATISGDRILYTPGADFRGTDTFTYTIEDTYGGFATATVTLSSPLAALEGAHGGLVKNAEGKEIGYFRVDAMASGAFSGSVSIDGESYRLQGKLSADGSYTGTIWIDGEAVTVQLRTTQTNGETKLSADFGGGRFTGESAFSSAEAGRRTELAGRYTLEFAGAEAAPDTGTDAGEATPTETETPLLPAGTGWAAIKLSEDGSARIKGRLSDGRSFSSRGLLTVRDGVATVTFYDDPSDTRVIGAYQLGDTVTGSMRVDRSRSDDDRFPQGYDLTQSATGARFFPPEDRERTLAVSAGEEAEALTIIFSGGDLSQDFTRNLQVDEEDRVTVKTQGPEDFRMKIDRDSGRFKANLTVDENGRRIKGTGVLIQGTGSEGARGAGIFNGQTQTGSIALTLRANAPQPTPTPTPAPTPVPTPTPTPAPTPAP
ncbi:MAG TPA: Ig-like domain-containing protein [Chthoniobacteraceae bacterium]|jgi:hypothetical protein